MKVGTLRKWVAGLWDTDRDLFMMIYMIIEVIYQFNKRRKHE